MRETFAIKVLTTDRSNLWIRGFVGMRKCYSITNVVIGRRLRRCTQNQRALKVTKPSSRSCPTGSRAICHFPPVDQGSGTGASMQLRPRSVPCRCGPLPAASFCHPVGDTVLARPPGLRAAEPGLRTVKLREPTAAGGRNLGLRRFRRRRLRQRGSRSKREPIGETIEKNLVSTAPERKVPKAGDPGSFIGGPGPLPR